MKVPMIATKDMVYAGRRIAKGGAFEARGKQDARLLSAIGRAEEAPTPVPAPIPIPVPAPSPRMYTYARVQPVSEPVVESMVEPVSEAEQADDEPAAKPKRAYRRRDMTSEG